MNVVVYTYSSRKAMEGMMEVRHDFGDIKQALERLHENPNNTVVG